MLKRFLYILCIGFSCCGGDDNNPDLGDSGSELRGVVQKGPFNIGSTVVVQELNNDLAPSGISFNVSTIDNLGNFSLNSELTSEFIEIICTGFYYNEVTGTNTDTNLTLRTIVRVSDLLEANINILTTLSARRIVQLATQEGLSYGEAKIQAEREVLAIFGIVDNQITDFEKLDISKTGTQHGALLAISALLQSDNSVSQLSELISTIIQDIESDGTLDSESIIEELIENARDLPLLIVRQNLQERLRELGLDGDIPPFEDPIENIWENQSPIVTFIRPLEGHVFTTSSIIDISVDVIDTDGSIIEVEVSANNVLIDNENLGQFQWTPENLSGDVTLKAIAIDDDGAVSEESTVTIQVNDIGWTQISNSPPFSTFGVLNGVALNGNIYALNLPPNDSGVIYKSLDGQSWNIVTNPIPWEGRIELMKTPFNEKIWIFTEDPAVIGLQIWSSTDGIKWDKFIDTDGFDLFSYFVFDDSFWGVRTSGDIYQLVENQWILKSNTNARGDLITTTVFKGEIITISTDISDFATTLSKSSSGITWSHTTPPFEITNDGMMVTFNDQLWVYPKKNGELIWFSSDGSVWESIPNTPPTDALFRGTDLLWGLSMDPSSVHSLKD